MDPQACGSAQTGTAQSNAAYQEAKRRGAKYLELLLMTVQQRQTSNLYDDSVKVVGGTDLGADSQQ